MIELSARTMERLGDLVDAKYGKALPRGTRRSGTVPVYGSNGVVGWHDAAISEGPTIVIGRKGSVGAINYSDVPCWPIDTAYYIDQPGPFQIEYLEFLLRSLRLSQLDRSTAIPGLSRDQFYDIEVSVPAIADQITLVNTLRKVVTHRDDAAGHLKKALRAMGRFRQAVLAAAYCGRLTADWRTQHEVQEDASHYFKRLLDWRIRGVKREPLEPFLEPELPELPESWLWASADTLTTVITKGTTPKAADMRADNGEIPYLKVYNLTFDGHIDFTVNPTFVASDIHNGLLRRSRVYPGDILINIVGPPLGKIGIVAPVYPEWNINQAIAVLRPIPDVNIDFVKFWLMSPPLLSHVARRAKATAGQHNLTLEICRELPIPFPPADEQAEIVRRLDQLLNLESSIRAKLEQAADNVSRSGQAILAKAFNGELTRTQVSGSIASGVADE
jgi:type I restriction enzyme S subunit